MIKSVIKMIFIILSSAAGILQAQDAASIDPTPLEKPEPFTTIETENPIALINELIDTVIAYGFTIKKSDKDELQFKASKSDQYEEKAEDRILIWLDRDAEKPLEKVHLFFLYGRYEEVWTHNKRGIFRIIIDDDFEKYRVGKLKETILKISMR